MKHLRKWGIPVLTGLVVLAALLLPERISALRDRQALGALHTVPLAEEDLTVREISLPEKLELLAQAILDPDLEVFSTTQSLPLPGEPGAEQVEETFFKSVEYLADWNVLPESFDLDTLEFQSGSPGGVCAVRRIPIRQYAVFAGSHRQPGQLLDRGGRGNRPAGLDRLLSAVSPGQKACSQEKNWEHAFWMAWGWRCSSAGRTCGKLTAPAG